MSEAAARIELAWEPPGPVAEAFMASRAQVQILNGPLGSGKTTAALMKAVRLAAAQRPSSRDQARDGKGGWVPVRKFKACVVRDTYRQLWKTTLPSWFKRVPRELGTFTGGEGAPATHRVGFVLPDRTVVDLHVDFIAMGDGSAEEVLDGYEPTVFVLDAANLLAKDVFTFAVGRTGRFPEMAEGGPSFHGTLAVCNAPQFSSWLWQDVMKLPQAQLRDMGIDIFVQPSGFSPHAENVRNLPAGYYVNQAKLNPKWYVDRLLKNLPGFDRAGKAIYDDFDDARHVSPVTLLPVDHLPLHLGVDGGGSPAAVALQRHPRQIRVLRELVAEQGTGPTRFGEDVARWLKQEFPGFSAEPARWPGQGGRTPPIYVWLDPSTFYGGDTERDGEKWAELFAHASGLRCKPASTNAPTARWEAVRVRLTRGAGEPEFLLSPECFVLREGFASGYRLKKVAGTDDRYHEEAEKNRYSHVHDGLQYGCLGAGEYLEILGRRSSVALIAQAQHETQWDPLAAGRLR